MKKRLVKILTALILAVILLVSCSTKDPTIMKFKVNPSNEYNTVESVEDVKARIIVTIKDKDYTLIDLEQMGAKILGLDFSKEGSHTLTILYDGLTLSYDSIVKGYTVLTDFEAIFKDLNLGEAEEVSEETVSDYEFIFFKKCKKQLAQTILLRGANEFMLDEVERSIHDALCAVKRVLESNSLVVGGGCVEVSTSIFLEYAARTLGSREQLAVSEFAEALNVIPKQLAINAAKDATDLLTKLRYVHDKAQSPQTTPEDAEKLKNTGLDLLNGKIKNNFNAGVFEPAMSKIKSLKFATEAAITILRIDDLIRIEPEKQQNQPGRGGGQPMMMPGM